MAAAKVPWVKSRLASSNEVSGAACIGVEARRGSQGGEFRALKPVHGKQAFG